MRLSDFFQSAATLSLSYRFAPGPIPIDHWTQDIEIGGGRIVGEACQAIDTCVALAGSPPVKVYAESVTIKGRTETGDDRVFITLRHENGCVSSVSYQAGGDLAFPSERIEIIGGGRSATVEAWVEFKCRCGMSVSADGYRRKRTKDIRRDSKLLWRRAEKGEDGRSLGAIFTGLPGLL